MLNIFGSLDGNGIQKALSELTEVPAWSYYSFRNFDKPTNSLDYKFKVGQTEGVIVLDVPGYAPDELTVTFEKAEKYNVIRIKIKADDKGRSPADYVHYLNKEMLVKDVEYKHGQLKINVYKDVPEENKPVTIDIILKE